ncbi:MAG TPA: hypothetical protein VGK10_01725 [Prolixibacteraceae bacterium]|jgi:hypothetical protein
MFYVFAIIIVFGIFLYINARPKRKVSEEALSEPVEEPFQVASDCCGAHEVCDFVETDFNEEVITYFDDEELDVLRNVRETDLTPEQIDNLREVLYTLKPAEINKWLISIGRRHIHLPPILQQEARQLIAER